MSLCSILSSYTFTHVELLWAAAECGVILLDEIPSNLVLWNLAGSVVGRGGARCGGSVSTVGGLGGGGVGVSGVVLLYRAVTLVGGVVAVDRNGGSLSSHVLCIRRKGVR